MSRRATEGSLFVGRLSKHTRTRDLEEVFETYGRLSRCDIKYGAEMAYAFVEYEDKRDAEDAMRYENGRDVCGSSIIVEWAKGNPHRGAGADQGNDECYKCHRTGHWARDCPSDRYGGGGRGGGGGGYGRGRGGDGGSRYGGGGRRDRSPRRSRSRSRDRRRRRSRSKDRRSRSLSRSRSGSPRQNSKSFNRSRSRSRSP